MIENDICAERFRSKVHGPEQNDKEGASISRSEEQKGNSYQLSRIYVLFLLFIFIKQSDRLKKRFE